MKPTSAMLTFIHTKLDQEEAKRRIESVRRADNCRQIVAIYSVYRALGGK